MRGGAAAAARRRPPPPRRRSGAAGGGGRPREPRSCRRSHGCRRGREAAASRGPPSAPPRRGARVCVCVGGRHELSRLHGRSPPPPPTPHRPTHLRSGAATATPGPGRRRRRGGCGRRGAGGGLQGCQPAQPELRLQLGPQWRQVEGWRISGAPQTLRSRTASPRADASAAAAAATLVPPHPFRRWRRCSTQPGPCVTATARPADCPPALDVAAAR